MLTPTQSVSSLDWESHQRLLFLEGEEVYGEIGLDNGKELFIDDVLETAQWYGILDILHFTFTFACLRGLSIQGSHPRTTVGKWHDLAKTLFDFTVKKLKEVLIPTLSVMLTAI
jgi:hypothetical protein